MRSIVDRTMSGTDTYVDVVISPATQARPVVTSVSQATRAVGSSSRMASRTASEIASATLSGCPSVTDSEVKRRRSDIGGLRWSEGVVAAEEIDEAFAEDRLGIRRRRGVGGSGRGFLRRRDGDAADDAFHQRDGARRDAQLSDAEADEGERHQRLRGHLAADGAVE